MSDIWQSDKFQGVQRDFKRAVGFRSLINMTEYVRNFAEREQQEVAEVLERIAISLENEGGPEYNSYKVDFEERVKSVLGITP
ncbi:MAG: hypothetical protein GC136_04580 [Alphaproteobacteria bacterium]|nr:hypothetical protein [Alphaproteobacteria bacterium]